MDQPIWLLSDVPERVRAWIVVDPLCGCWRYTRGKPGKGGYRKIKWHDKSLGVHRLVYILLVGPIAAGLTLDHVKARGCRWNDCCWPAHLEPVTRGVNTLRGEGPSARNARKTECDNGHEYTPENTFVRKDGRRDCRACMRDRARRDYHQKAEREGRSVKPRRPYKLRKRSPRRIMTK